MYEDLTIADLTSEGRRILWEESRPNDEIGDCWFDLAKVLIILHHRKPDVEIFKGWCAEIGIFWRCAYDVMNLRKRFLQQEIEPPKGISWKALSFTAPVLTWKNKDHLFQLCREKKLRELKVLVKEYPRE